jgi:hypothetical protein
MSLDPQWVAETAFPIELDNFQRVGIVTLEGETNLLKQRLPIVLSSPLLLLFAAALPANAASPHFISASAALTGTNLTVSFKEAGLGDNQRIDYTASALAAATYVCVNEGGANPKARNKRNVIETTNATGTFETDNGQVTASLIINPPSAGDFSCPSGQSLRTAQVTYTQVEISDDTNDITQTIPGTFDTGCLLPEVRNACSANAV